MNFNSHRDLTEKTASDSGREFCPSLPSDLRDCRNTNRLVRNDALRYKPVLKNKNKHKNHICSFR